MIFCFFLLQGQGPFGWNDFANTREIGTRQAVFAQQLWASATTPLSTATFGFVHTYVDMSNVTGENSNNSVSIKSLSSKYVCVFLQFHRSLQSLATWNTLVREDLETALLLELPTAPEISISSKVRLICGGGVVFFTLFSRNEQLKHQRVLELADVARAGQAVARGDQVPVSKTDWRLHTGWSSFF